MAVILAVAVMAVAIPRLLVSYNFIPMLKLEQAAIDFRFRLRGNIPASPDCAVIGIDAASMDPGNLPPGDVAHSEALQLMRRQWPWNRKVYALLLDKLMAAGARTVVIDILFLNPGEGDDDLAVALRKYGDRVVIGSVFALDDNDTMGKEQVFRVPAPDLLGATKGNITGCATLPRELDGVVRRTWYWTSELSQYGYPDNGRDIISMAGLAVSKFRPGLTLPDGMHYINYQGPATTYAYLPVEELFMDSIYNSPKYDGGNIFKDKVVFVGPLAEMFHDTLSTPYGSMPGVEIHAQIAGSLLQGTTLRDAPDWLALALALPMALLAAWISVRMTHALALSGVLAACVLIFAWIAQWAFVKDGMLIPMVTPLIAFCVTGLFGLVFSFLLEQLDKSRIRTVMDRYVSRSVAELVLAESDQFEKALRGQRREVTALFSDIRGFTTMTEAAVPEELIGQLNEYFYRMVETVLKGEGTLQQFVGDAIMAVWGNTHTVEPATGARQAVRAALEMQAALTELNTMWEANPLRQKLDMGIGVNHGEVVVGSLGHPQRMEFTTIGDGINTAARLETATKQLGCMILVGEAVERLTRDWFHYRHVGRVRFKGKTKHLEVYAPLGEATTARPEWLDGYHAAVELYRRREFSAAIGAFQQVKSAIGGEDGLCEIYIERCNDAMSHAPGADWDGSWMLSEK